MSKGVVDRDEGGEPRKSEPMHGPCEMSSTYEVGLYPPTVTLLTGTGLVFDNSAWWQYIFPTD
jgi:hypothetical protein